MKVYDPGNRTICYELTVCSFQTQHMYFHIYAIITIICKYYSI